MTTKTRFTGLTLTESDAAALKAKRTGVRLSAREFRRIRTLEMLNQGFSVRATAVAVGGYPREVSRVGKRYLEGGLEHALTDNPRPKPERLLDSTQEAAIVALVCGPPPEGSSRWSVRLLAAEVARRGIVEKVGRESVRKVLSSHELKPWREKNVVRAGDRRAVRRTHGGRAGTLRPAP